MKRCKALQEMKEFRIMPGQALRGGEGEFPKRKEGGVQSMHEIGYTVTNFVTVEDLPECQRLGIKAIVIEDPKFGWHKTRCVKPEQLRNKSDRLMYDDAELDRRAKKLVEDCKPFGDTVLSYYIFDEPSVQHFAYLKRVSDALRRYDDEKMLFINLFPTYAKPQQLGVDTDFDPSKFNNQVDNITSDVLSMTTEQTYQAYLSAYGEIVQPTDFVRYDNFSVMRMAGVNKQNDDEALSDYLLNLLMVKKFADENGIEAWNTGSGTQIRPHANVPTPANLALQAYTTMAAGYQGMGWFGYYKSHMPNGEGRYNYHEAPIDTHNEEKSITFYMMQEINRQTQICGQYLMDMKHTKLYFRNVAQLNNHWLDEKSAGDVLANVKSYDDAPMMVGEFEKRDGTRWFMVVNLDQARAIPVTYKLADGFTKVKQVSLGTGNLIPVDIKHPSYILPGSGVLCKAMK